MLLHPQFDPVAFSLGPLSVRWYGLMYLVAFVQFIALGRYRIKTRPGLLTVEQLDDLLFYGMLGVIVGGRLGQVLFYEPAYYLAHPLEIFAVWKGGMAFHGGFLGVLYNEDDRLAATAIAALEAEELTVGDQLPYSGKLLNATMNRHAEGNAIPYVGIEMRQDLVGDAAGQALFAARLARMCHKVALNIAG